MNDADGVHERHRAEELHRERFPVRDGEPPALGDGVENFPALVVIQGRKASVDGVERRRGWS